MTGQRDRVGLIGFGAIGRQTVDLLAQQPGGGAEVVAALVRDAERDRPVSGIPLVTTVDALLALRPDVALEFGGHEALRSHGPAVLAAGVDLLMLSHGALADPLVEQAIRDAARQGGSQARILSGAIGGLDALSAAAIGGLERVELVSRKPATSLLSAEEAATLTEPRVLYQGSAREAALLFPESVNVAAAVSLAGVGFDRTIVTVVADPTIRRNCHAFTATGTFGTMRFEIENVPSVANPRSASIVAMSAVRVLSQRSAMITVS